MKSEGKEEEKDGNNKLEVEELRGWWEEQNGKERGTEQRRWGEGGLRGKKEKGRGGKGEEEKRQ